MRDFNTLDSNSFKSFYLAAETLNFTEAARRGSMTQSGVSQHIARLEEQLEAPLFLRNGKSLLLTEAGKILREYVEKFLDEQENLREKIIHEHRALSGSVTYAMPESCLLSPHFGILLNKRIEKYPDITLKVDICPTPLVIEKVLSGQIDFGFVTREISNPLLKFSSFCPEEYVLVSGKQLRDQFESVEQLAEHPFILYPGFDVIFEKWFVTHFPKKKNFTWEHLQVSGEINTLKGAIDMVIGHLGVTVIPKHCVSEFILKKKLFEIRDSFAKDAVNQISIATLENRVMTRRAQAILDAFFAMKKS